MILRYLRPPVECTPLLKMLLLQMKCIFRYEFEIDSIFLLFNAYCKPLYFRGY